MSYLKLVGSRCYVSQTDPKAGAAKAISNITNATTAQVTATTHGYANTNEILLDVGWEDFDESVFRVSNITANTYDLPGYDSSNTDFYPQGSDTGNGYLISDWVEVGQILGATGQGGDARSEELNPWDKRNGVRIYYGFNASSLELELGFDRTLSAQQYLEAASRVLGKRAFKFILNGPTYGYLYGTVSMSPLPRFENVLRRNLTISSDGGIFTTFS